MESLEIQWARQMARFYSLYLTFEAVTDAEKKWAALGISEWSVVLARTGHAGFRYDQNVPD